MIEQTAQASKEKLLTVLGLDLSLRSTGYCISTFSKCTWGSLPNKKTGCERLVFIEACVAKLIKDNAPDLAVLENYSYGSEGRAYQIGELGGVVRVALFKVGIPYLEVEPTVLKKFATGNGGAGKKQIMTCVEKYYGVNTEGDDDAADAVCAARFGEIYLTGATTRRCELQTVEEYKKRHAGKN